MTTIANQTSILILCRCGWVGLDSSTANALRGWHDHAFNIRGGMHERVGEMAISNPLNALGMARVREEAADMARLARWKGYREHQGELTMGADTLALAEMRLRRGALTALAMVLGLGGVVLTVVGIWRAF